MSNSFGKLFKLTTFGESHGPAIGGILDGCPAGLHLDLRAIQKELLNFMDWLHKGSPLSIVSKVEFKTGELKNFVGFKITY
jgi:hypothetical protein